jgi:rod shape-determining protein MreC
MPYIPVEPPPFFRRGPSPLARLAFFGCISIALLFVDTRYHYLEGLRHVAAVVLYPLQRVVQMPGEALGWVGGYFVSLRELSEDNVVLKRQSVEHAAVAQSYAATQDENARLRALLDMRNRFATGAKAVEVLYTGRDPFAQKLFVDKGHGRGHPGGRSGDRRGRGRGSSDARVSVHGGSDARHRQGSCGSGADPAERRAVRAVRFRRGRPPELRFMAPSADIQVGDVLVTSGLDGTYPPGLAVARVATLDRETGQIFARIACTPLAGVDRSEHLLVVGRQSPAMARPEEPAAQDQGKKMGRAKRRGGATP